jgi:hypothetical protein
MGVAEVRTYLHLVFDTTYTDDAEDTDGKCLAFCKHPGRPIPNQSSSTTCITIHSFFVSLTIVENQISVHSFIHIYMYNRLPVFPTELQLHRVHPSGTGVTEIYLYPASNDLLPPRRYTVPSSFLPGSWTWDNSIACHES